MRTLTLALMTLAAPALAQDNSLRFTAGLGVQNGPGYFGADTTTTGATGSFAFGSLRYGGFAAGGDGAPTGFGLTGSFRYIGGRSVDDFAELDGLEDIDAAVELGGGFSYNWTNADLYLVVRRGFGGHEGIVAEVGSDVILPASDSMTLRAGPRVTAGDDTFVDTYFGVTAAESAAGGLAAFTGTQGIVSRGFEISADFDLSGPWGVTASARYDQLLNDAADSPISISDDQTSISLVVTREFNLSF